MGRINKYRRYVIDVTGLDPLSLGELEGSGACSRTTRTFRYFELEK